MTNENEWHEKLHALANVLKVSVGGNLAKEYQKETVTDDELYEHLLITPLESLRDYAGPSFTTLEPKYQHQVIATLLLLMKLDDGIEITKLGERPMWLRVYPYAPGKLPGHSADKFSYLRLDTITQVIPDVGIGVGEDPQDWKYTLSVMSGGTRFHPTISLFRGTAFNQPLARLLAQIAESIVG